MIKKVVEFQWKRVISEVISTIGMTSGAAAARLNCMLFLYEPEIPEELQEEME
ncbi:cyclic lactone autoinducer peptide [Oceanobacillus piezotolerans]|uniref:Cyclic lactone autoinducer peptide n=1 Tax=Oceanobacillus piezotolerans TaxID=2448030 RepID=A0A498D670_9BACI|nr:cyclic lactone autoinducer peptide [Oceanobacillus piezotolerans]RLL42890.1 cyclic lactone autoinducer peptide [Oceanobacillus piezotolerans]